MGEDIVRLLPLLRSRARELVIEEGAADTLVERTLIRALREAASYDQNSYVEEWLISLMVTEWEVSRPRH